MQDVYTANYKASLKKLQKTKVSGKRPEFMDWKMILSGWRHSPNYLQT